MERIYKHKLAIRHKRIYRQPNLIRSAAMVACMPSVAIFAFTIWLSVDFEPMAEWLIRKFEYIVLKRWLA